METYHLKRGYNAGHVTLGMLTPAKGEFKQAIYTLEEPWKDNQRGISCIPTGEYICHPHSGTMQRNVWEVKNVPNRNAILIHSGNTTNDIQGCILVGLSHGTFNYMPAVLNSRRAMDILRDTIGVNNSFKLIIT